ncbi:ArnT family glycosyltransferase [Paludibacterium paludis]|uniref:Membrane protein n=1 Tax=Paludibacterium paludis TaxID=1225769 RepID=A0A918NY56_9NEIS|nr:hypothetical protein [Paludibacterium paludis]GGY06124.1 membrane protein [Paludibacterium paludis]
MLTYTPDSASKLPVPTEKPWLLLLLAFLWLWPGIFGHDPWRPDEPYTMAVVSEMLRTGNWMLLSIQGEPYLTYPPLYYWVSSAFVSGLSPWLMSPVDAARLATPFFMALSLLFAGCAGRELIGRRHGRSVVLIMMGCLGLMDTGHQLTPVVAGFAGFSAAFYALILALRSPALGGVLLGAASVVLFLSSSLLEVMLVWAVAVMLPAFAAWRTRRYVITLAMALLFGLPLALIWPMKLAASHPAMFDLWWSAHALGPLEGFSHLGLFHDVGYYFITSIWYAWPAWPLAAWTLWRSRRYDEPLLQLPLMFFAIIILLLTFSDRQATEHAMPLLLPMALLAAIELDSVKRGAAAFLNWFGLMTFGFFGLVLWLGWFALHFGWPGKLAERAAYLSPFYRPEPAVIAPMVAVVATLVWGWAVTRRNLRGRQAVTNWAAGLTLFWGLAATLALPWVNSFKSYGPVVERMEAQLPVGVDCVGVAKKNMMARISWDYYAHRTLKAFDTDQDSSCSYRLIMRPRDEATVDVPGWKDIWVGSRPREKREIFVLQQRVAVPAAGKARDMPDSTKDFVID